jgi:hypothetical protein
MISCFLGLVIMVGVVVGVISFIIWSIKQHQVAQKYHQLERIQAFNPPPRPVAVPGWSITYKDGRVTKVMTINMENEKDAIGEAMKRGVGPRDIISSVKV